MVRNLLIPEYHQQQKNLKTYKEFGNYTTKNEFANKEISNLIAYNENLMSKLIDLKKKYIISELIIKKKEIERSEKILTKK